MTNQQIKEKIKQIEIELKKNTEKQKEIDKSDFLTEVGQKIYARNTLLIKKEIELIKEKESLLNLL